MRRLTAAGLCAALQVGAFQAPLVHAHLDDHHDDHHDAPAVHAHFGGHGPAKAGRHVQDYVASGFSRTPDHPGVAVPDEPEHTTRLQIFVAVESAVLTTPALAPARFVLAPAPESAMRRQPEVVRSHGPPPPRTTAPRAPPASSV